MLVVVNLVCILEYVGGFKKNTDVLVPPPEIVMSFGRRQNMWNLKNFQGDSQMQARVRNTVLGEVRRMQV